MKKLLLIALLFAGIACHAQEKLIPGKNSFEAKWIKNEQYTMYWYALSDTTKVKIGEIGTTVRKGHATITVVTRVFIKQMKSPWTDSTTALITTLTPIRHSSYNAQRDIVLNFGKIVRGIYFDKAKNISTVIADTTHSAYYDSNLYPSLIAWLPLNERFRKNVAVYDYNPDGHIGVSDATILKVVKGIYTSEISGQHEVWVVTVTDDLGGGKTNNTFYIDIADRKLWKQEIRAGSRNMLLLRAEDEPIK